MRTAIIGERASLRQAWDTVPRWAQTRPWQTNAALIGLGIALIGFTRQFVSESDHFSIGFSGVSSASLVLWLAACAILLALPGNVDGYTFPIILTIAVLCRLVVLFPAPFLSTDVYRYAWDGVVQHAHISPYRYVPADPALSFLRAPNQDLYDNINRRDYAHTIYPPAAQALFYLITWIGPSVTMMKTAMVLFEGLTLWGLIALLAELGVRRERTILYAWCPMLIWEFAGNGHLDSAAMAFIVLALLFRYRRKPVLTGVFLALAVLIKIYPLVLLPALYQRGRDSGKQAGWTMPATVAALAVVFYAAYSSVGMRVFGFLGGYVQEEGMESGTRYFLLEWAQHLPGLHALSSAVYLAFCVGLFLGLTIWTWRTACRQESVPDAFLAPAFTFAAALMLLFSPHYPWYIAWLVPFLVLQPNLPMFTYIGAFFYLCTTALAVGMGPKQFVLNEYLYGAMLAAVMISLGAHLLRRTDALSHLETW
jgi:hypothetical protein